MPNKTVTEQNRKDALDANNIWQKYFAGKKSLSDCLKFNGSPIPEDANYEFTEDQLANLIQQIAGDAAWTKQVSNLSRYRTPNGVWSIRHTNKKTENKLSVFNNYIKERKEKFAPTRTTMTKEFYELIKLLNTHKGNSATCSILLIAFCQKWNLTKHLDPVEIIAAPETTRKVETTNNINLLLLDAESFSTGNTFTSHLSIPERIKQHTSFFDNETQRINLGRYNKVIVASSAQEKNGIAAQATTTLLPFAIDYMGEKSSCETQFDSFLMGDILAKPKSNSTIKKAGDSFLQSQNSSAIPKSIPYDPNKILTVYAHAHRGVLLNPNADHFVITMYESDEEKLHKLHEFYSKNQDLLPKQVKLRLYKYDTKEKTNYLPAFRSPDHGNYVLTEIQGTAEKPDEKYEWTVRWFALKALYPNSSIHNIELMHTTCRYEENIHSIFDPSKHISDVKNFRMTAKNLPKTKAQDGCYVVYSNSINKNFIKQQQIANKPSEEKKYITNSLDLGDVSGKTARQYIEEHYLAGKLSLTYYMKILVKYGPPINSEIVPFTRINFNAILNQIAFLPIWETQGFKLFGSKIPEGINAIRNNKLPACFSDSLQLPNFNTHSLFDTRSKMTKEFYELFHVLHFLQDSDYSSEIGLDIMAIFCRKWKIAMPDNNDYILESNISNKTM